MVAKPMLMVGDKVISIVMVAVTRTELTVAAAFMNATLFAKICMHMPAM